MAYRVVADDKGNVVAIVCTRGARHQACSTPGCRNNATLQCDFAVTRKGKPGTCDRYVCRVCAVRVGPDLDYCAAHARLRAAPKETA